MDPRLASRELQSSFKPLESSSSFCVKDFGALQRAVVSLNRVWAPLVDREPPPGPSELVLRAVRKDYDIV